LRHDSMKTAAIAIPATAASDQPIGVRADQSTLMTIAGAAGPHTRTAARKAKIGLAKIAGVPRVVFAAGVYLIGPL
jgi:hypothetical protein